ncbi:iduronate 2-sulfatase-like [Pollicipes pollicipes]|uniref:iduronate 2-sulfatase-like n=1 Tax=Pollicipes pollicipes TaxID=41117 RepID=UPI00188559A3|nr:iduronate 2-sulfatase-like [Pollicipes pollicipes]
MRAPSLLLLLALSVGAAGRLNVLLVLVDDLRPALGCYGDPLAVTPNLDRLAVQSTLFSRAYAQQALCGPSRTSLLTSRRPDTTRLFDTGSYWRQAAGNFSSLPQLFRERGYYTASMGKVFHPGIVSNYSDDQPYSWSEPPYHPSSQADKDAPVCLGEDGKPHSNLYCPVDVSAQPQRTLPDIQTVQRAARWLQDRSGRAEPWMLAVGLHKPHIPLKMPWQYLNLYPIDSVSPPAQPTRPAGLPPVAWNPWSDVRHRDDVRQLNISFPYGPMPGFFARFVRQAYYAAVSYVDELVGQLLEALATAGHADNTVILLCGDHGWALGERGEWAKYSTSEDATRTPLLLHLPSRSGSLAGFRRVSALHRLQTRPVEGGAVHVSTPVELVDPPPAADVVAACDAPVAAAAVAFSQYPRPSVTPRADSDQPRLRDVAVMGFSARSARYRYTEWVRYDPATMRPLWRHLVADELYDHAVDPLEAANLAQAPTA